MKLVVVGGGWAGCAAAYQGKKMGAEVILLERTDMLLGTGLVGGIMRNNGRFTATEEMIALGGGEVFAVIDNNCLHKDVNFPGHNHASFYNVSKIHEEILKLLEKIGVEIKFNSRVSSVKKVGARIISVTTDSKETYLGDVFIDTTGTAGPMANCIKYGNGCSMCVLRCPTFQGRISLCSLAGVQEIMGKRDNDNIGAMSGSCKLSKDSIDNKIIEKLNKNGFVVVPIDNELKENHLSLKACQQYALNEYKDNIILLDTGHAKMMTPYFPLEKLRKIKGFESARYIDPYSGGKGNSMRFFAIPKRDNTLKVEEIDNLFCAGEKVGLFVGHTEAIITGVLAGYNSINYVKDKPLLDLSRKTMIGEGIAFINEEINNENISKKFTFSGSILFEHLKKLELYTTNIQDIKKRIEKLELKDIFNKYN